DKKAAEAYITGIFRNLNRGEQYQLTYLEPFSAGLWEAGFPAELDGVYNDYDAIKVFFSPEQEKIAALTVHHTPYEGSGEVAITAEQAKTIVQEKISFSGNAQAQEAVLVFTKPIPFFEQEKEGIDSVPGEAFFAENKVVKAWKVTLLIENTTEYGWDTTVYVFVDCATGDIVGGDGLR
ncbi:MAG: hypothetical protein LBT22_06950, partial [Peptococcaceae bacterium]|nr:hypothetical protein [Peptococcaceae bacterium]